MMLDKFYAKTMKIGDSAFVLVPNNIMKFTGLDIGEEVIVYIGRKKEVEKDGGHN